MEERLRVIQNYSEYKPYGPRAIVWKYPKVFLPYGLVGIENPKAQELVLYITRQYVEIADEIHKNKDKAKIYGYDLYKIINLNKPIGIDSLVVGGIYLIPTRGYEILYFKLVRIIKLDHKIKTKYVERIKHGRRESDYCHGVVYGNISHIYEFSLGNINCRNIMYGKFNSTGMELYSKNLKEDPEEYKPMEIDRQNRFREKFKEPFSFLMDLIIRGDNHPEDYSLSLVIVNNISHPNGDALTYKASFPNLYYDIANAKAPDGSGLLDGITFKDSYEDVPFVEGFNKELIRTIMDEANLDSDVVAQVVSIFKNEPDYYINLSDDSGNIDDSASAGIDADASASANAGIDETGGGDNDNTIFTIRFYFVMLIFLLILLVFLVYTMKPKEDATLNLKKNIYTPN